MGNGVERITAFGRGHSFGILEPVDVDAYHSHAVVPRLDDLVIADKAAREMKDLQSLRDRLQALSLEIAARVGEEGKLFGSVTSANIADLLAQKGFKTDRRKIMLDESLREVGEHTVQIRLAPDLIAEVPLTITAEEA